MEFLIPGIKPLHISNLVFDFNGTIAVDGTIIEKVADQLNVLSETYNIHIITADTFGTAKDQLQSVCCEVVIIPEEKQSESKLQYIKNLGEKSCVCFGNGRNDYRMLQEAAIGIALMQEEGVSRKSLMASDIVCNTIIDALDLFLKPGRLKATLRS